LASERVYRGVHRLVGTDLTSTHPRMAKGKSKRKHKDGPSGAEGGAGPSADYEGPGESWGGEHMNQAPAPLMAMHPSGAHIAVAYGKGVAVFDASTGAQIPLRAAANVPSIGEGVAHTPASPEMRAPLEPDGLWHADAIRAIAFDPTGRFLATAADDKAVRLFARTPAGDAYECVRRWRDRKKPTALAYDDDGKHLMISNKYGDVHVVLTNRAPNDPVGTDHEHGALREVDDPAFLLGHCCAVVTDLTCPRGSNLLVTADRDHKLRASNLPTSVPLIHGSWDIQSFLFGHLAFVSCAAAVPEPERHRDDEEEVAPPSTESAKDDRRPKKIERLASGGGDGAVRLFRLDDGEELASAQLSTPVDPPSPEELEAIISGTAPRIPVNAPAVTSIDAHPSGAFVVAAVEGAPEVVLMDVRDSSLRMVAKIPVPVLGDDAEVTCVRFEPSPSGRRLWVAGTVGADAKPFFRCARLGWEMHPGKEETHPGKMMIDGKEMDADPADDVLACKMRDAMAPHAPGEDSSLMVSKGTALRKKQYDNVAEIAERKKLRRDVTKGKRTAE